MIPEAKELPQVKAVERGDNFTTVAVFVIENECGLWRQVSRDGRQGLKCPDGHRVAHIAADRLVELTRWHELEAFLSQHAALDVIPANEDGEPIAP